jgi:hypothetical protein
LRSWALLLLLASCSQAIDNNAEAPPSAASSARNTAAPAPDARPDEVFVAVITGSEGYNAPEALPSGMFLIENGCLVFRYSGAQGITRTPLLPPGSRLARSGDSETVTIGGVAVPIGRQVSVAGGGLPNDVVKNPIPPRCPQEAMLVTAVPNS